MKPVLFKTTLFVSIASLCLSGCMVQEEKSVPNPIVHTSDPLQNQPDLMHKLSVSAAPTPVPPKAATDPQKAVQPSPSPKPEAQPVPQAQQQVQQPSQQSTPAPQKTNKKIPRQAEGAPASTASKKSVSANRLTLSQLVKKYPDLLLLKGSPNSKQVALTFDDAPDTRYTIQVLDILKQYNVKATFFVVGRLAEKHPSVVKRMHREGHVIGNHTYNHALLTKLTDEQFQNQIAKTQKVVKNAVGYTPRLIRPPYGEITESQLLWASNHHYKIVNWNVDSRDWKQLSQAEVTANVLNHAGAGSIILQHSGGGPNQNLSGTVAALPTIIESLQSKGYRLVTLPELLKVSKQL
ncbi:polysaccharide deacetylase family protein [Paenibacillus sp. OAS669]|uniref:polysaccharide deacetylase family protein n=1 Tax=Paenibacillus sp. OAS669 TaxID=2663821 RepID=UPI001789E4A4|nr:polysaccharide deacetylase family protein [Paenibacillus sp. OAS669]MBE1442213.1 polysaccharide deacetylase family sporulation protein PdaB [Paenibacillus sp. OAS669]